MGEEEWQNNVDSSVDNLGGKEEMDEEKLALGGMGGFTRD